MIGRSRHLCLLAICLFYYSVVNNPAMGQNPAATDWPNYGNDLGGMRYSQVSHVNRENVTKLKVAWTFHTGDISQGSPGRSASGFETIPSSSMGSSFSQLPLIGSLLLIPKREENCGHTILRLTSAGNPETDSLIAEPLPGSIRSCHQVSHAGGEFSKPRSTLDLFPLMELMADRVQTLAITARSVCEMCLHSVQAGIT